MKDEIEKGRKGGDLGRTKSGEDEKGGQGWEGETAKRRGPGKDENGGGRESTEEFSIGRGK